MDYFNKNLIAATKEVTKQLERIGERLTSIHTDLDNLKNAVKKASDTGCEQQQGPSKIIAEADVPKGIEIRKGEPDATEDKKYQLRSLRVQSLTLAAVVIYAAITGLIFLANKDAADAARKAAEAARDSANSQAALIRGENAARCVLRLDLVPDVLTVEFTNHGKVGTRRFGATLKITKLTLPRQESIGEPLNLEIKSDRISPQDPLTKTYSIGFTRPFRGLLLQTRRMITAEGSMNYDDGFGYTIHEPFCFSYVAGVSNASGSTQEGWRTCDTVPGFLDQVREAEQQRNNAAKP